MCVCHFRSLGRRNHKPIPFGVLLPSTIFLRCYAPSLLPNEKYNFFFPFRKPHSTRSQCQPTHFPLIEPQNVSTFWWGNPSSPSRVLLFSPYTPFSLCVASFKSFPFFVHFFIIPHSPFSFFVALSPQFSHRNPNCPPSLSLGFVFCFFLLLQVSTLEPH